ncbi:MAG: hypothetical protein NTV39_00135 [Candidatus Saccharibacteria bacterium]|nr:hypothetical protein [Candidatus Saccharibacteria bacterium]
MKKRIIIISASITAIVIIIVGAVIFSSHHNTQKQVTTTKNTSNGIVKIEKGLESMAKIAIPAVENYATQDPLESYNSRKNRLIPYFAPDSPVFNRVLDIQNPDTGIAKTRAKVTSVSLSKTAEGTYPFLIVGAKVANYSDATKLINTELQTYWIIIKTNPDGSFIANDIGIWVE